MNVGEKNKKKSSLHRGEGEMEKERGMQIGASLQMMKRGKERNKIIIK